MIIVDSILNGKIVIDISIPFRMIDEDQTKIILIVSGGAIWYLYDGCTNIDQITISWMLDLSGVEFLNV